MNENPTVFEQMTAGFAYRPDEECAQVHARATRLATQLQQQYLAGDESGCQDTLKELLGSMGRNSVFRPGAVFDYGVNTHVGEGCFFNFNCVFLDVAPIRFGNAVLVGTNVQFLTPTHPVNPVDRRAAWEGGLPITVEDNVWIGGGAILLPGVSIGENSIIGAGAVVSRDIPANSIAVGNPARVIKTISMDERPATGQYSAVALGIV